MRARGASGRKNAARFYGPIMTGLRPGSIGAGANYELRMVGSAYHGDRWRTEVDPSHAKQLKDVMVVPMLRFERSGRHGPFAEALADIGLVPAGTPSFSVAATKGNRSIQVAACSNKPFEYVRYAHRTSKILRIFPAAQGRRYLLKMEQT